MNMFGDPCHEKTHRPTCPQRHPRVPQDGMCHRSGRPAGAAAAHPDDRRRGTRAAPPVRLLRRRPRFPCAAQRAHGRVLRADPLGRPPRLAQRRGRLRADAPGGHQPVPGHGALSECPGRWRAAAERGSGGSARRGAGGRPGRSFREARRPAARREADRRPGRAPAHRRRGQCARRRGPAGRHPAPAGQAAQRQSGRLVGGGGTFPRHARHHLGGHLRQRRLRRDPQGRPPHHRRGPGRLPAREPRRARPHRAHRETPARQGDGVPGRGVLRLAGGAVRGDRRRGQLRQPRPRRPAAGPEDPVHRHPRHRGEAVEHVPDGAGPDRGVLALLDPFQRRPHHPARPDQGRGLALRQPVCERPIHRHRTRGFPQAAGHVVHGTDVPLLGPSGALPRQEVRDSARPAAHLRP
ncbi:hypothetical protein SGPA1_20836 [Streptomyces misionensis JCM 4497]